MRTNISSLKKSPISKILRMTLYRKWFDDIAAGIKPEEYREIKPYWEKRLSRDYDVIEFRNGYSSNCPVMWIEYKGYEKKTIFNPMTNKKEKVFALKLGRIMEIRNYEVQTGDCRKNLPTN
jgi:hypothetical protein